MSKIVVKFGGTSVANIERILNAAKLIKSKVDEGHKVVVVVSAMSGVTNDLRLALAVRLGIGGNRQESADIDTDPKDTTRSNN